MINENDEKYLTDLHKAERAELLSKIEIQKFELEKLTAELRHTSESAEKAHKKISTFDKFATIGYFTLDPDSTICELNLSGTQMLGRERHDLINSKFDSYVADKTKPVFNNFLKEVFTDRSRATCEVMLRIKDNLSIFIHIEGVVPENEEKCFITAVDITDRNLAEQTVYSLLNEKELILKEVHHRVKNNMYNIGAMLNMQANMVENPETKNVLFDAAGRVQSMSVLYDKLYRSEYANAVSIKEYFPDLIHEIVNIFPQKRSVKVKTNIEDIVIDAKILSILGIIINELITNSMKYAFTGRNDGLITVSCSMIEKRLSIIYSDNGPGIPESITFKNSKGFGMQLIDMLAMQLKGKLTLERNNGTQCIIEFEL